MNVVVSGNKYLTSVMYLSYHINLLSRGWLENWTEIQYKQQRGYLLKLDNSLTLKNK